MTVLQDYLDANQSIVPNLVVEFDTSPVSTFSKKQIDSGKTIDSDKVGLIDSVAVNPTVIDIKRMKQQVNSAAITILDKDNAFSNLLGQPLSALINLKVTVYYGVITGSYDWADYEKIGEYFIRTIRKIGEQYKIDANSQIDRLSVPVYQVKHPLASAITDIQTTLTINSVDDVYASSGRVKIADEWIVYTGKTFTAPNTTLTGCVRGSDNSTATGHSQDTLVIQGEKFVGNPIDGLLQLMISDGTQAGGYNVLLDGAALDETLIDVAKFEQIRTDFFSLETDFTLWYYDIEDLLKYLEQKYLRPNNIRFTENNGLISASVLDQTVPGQDLEEIDQTVIVDKSEKWSITDKEIINTFNIRYRYNDGRGEYTASKFFQDADSVATYGVKRGKDLLFDGIVSNSVAQDRGDRFMERFKTPYTQIQTENVLRTYKFQTGDKIRLTHPDIPSPGGGIGLSNEMEILKRAIDFAKSTVRMTYVFTTYNNIRRGFIAPFGVIQSVISAKKFTVATGLGSLYKADFVLGMYDISGQTFFSEPLNIVASVDGDTITMVNDFINIAATTTAVKFPIYDLQDFQQQAAFASIVPNSGLFADGNGGYKIY